ncbi:MAG: hypothetical protein H7X97_07070 [Opitutaceae bacterium]|nr:hypothetical protein [Verrucomicrobiales bacterium]
MDWLSSLLQTAGSAYSSNQAANAAQQTAAQQTKAAQANAAAQASSTKTLILIGAGGLILVVILALVFRKK